MFQYLEAGLPTRVKDITGGPTVPWLFAQSNVK